MNKKTLIFTPQTITLLLQALEETKPTLQRSQHRNADFARELYPKMVKKLNSLKGQPGITQAFDENELLLLKTAIELYKVLYPNDYRLNAIHTQLQAGKR